MSKKTPSYEFDIHLKYARNNWMTFRKEKKIALSILDYIDIGRSKMNVYGLIEDWERIAEPTYLHHNLSRVTFKYLIVHSPYNYKEPLRVFENVTDVIDLDNDHVNFYKNGLKGKYKNLIKLAFNG